MLLEIDLVCSMQHAACSIKEAGVLLIIDLILSTPHATFNMQHATCNLLVSYLTLFLSEATATRRTGRKLVLGRLYRSTKAIPCIALGCEIAAVFNGALVSVVDECCLMCRM